jgi:hypothetical protein
LELELHRFHREKQAFPPRLSSGNHATLAASLPRHYGFARPREVFFFLRNPSLLFTMRHKADPEIGSFSSSINSDREISGRAQIAARIDSSCSASRRGFLPLFNGLGEKLFVCRYKAIML